MKEFLTKLLFSKREQRKALADALVNGESKEERSATKTALDNLDAEIESIETELRKLEAEELDPFKIKDDEKRSATNDMEYRTAFMNYVQTGTSNPVLKRASSGTHTDLGILLPETIIQEVIKEVDKVYGHLYSKVKHTNLKGGVKHPLGSFSAQFKRVGKNAVSTRQHAGEVTGYVSFEYNIGEIRIARSLLEVTLSVEAFETEFAKVIAEAYVRAMDYEIVNGNPTNNECEGILTEAAKSESRIKASQVIEFTADEMKDWTSWQTKLFAKIPLAMRGLRPEFVLTANTWEANIVTLKDKNDQVVAREIYNPVTGDETCVFKGREVVLVEDDIVKSFDDATNGEVFGLYWVPSKAYAINTNLQFAVDHYFDKETNEYIDKALVINDGKLLDPKYIYILKKKVTA